MNLRYEEDFVEAVVFLCAHGRRPGVPPLQVARFHRAREKSYATLDPDERNAAFFQLHLEWFREWDLEKLLADLLGEFPLLDRSLDVLAFRKARNKNDEGAELYVNHARQRHAVVALRPQRFVDDATLGTFLRHEFLHIHDMVDPAFGYAPELQLQGVLAAQERLVRERYRRLWDITIDGRSVASGHLPMASETHHRAALERAFPFWPPLKQNQVFATLWNHPAPRHADLMTFAADPRDLAHASQPVPGAPCPLCGFPTFDWADLTSIDPRMHALIQIDFPHWTPSHGLCRRCCEMFAANAAASA